MTETTTALGIRRQGQPGNDSNAEQSRPAIADETLTAAGSIPRVPTAADRWTRASLGVYFALLLSGVGVLLGESRLGRCVRRAGKLRCGKLRRPACAPCIRCISYRQLLHKPWKGARSLCVAQMRSARMFGSLKHDGPPSLERPKPLPSFARAARRGCQQIDATSFAIESMYMKSMSMYVMVQS